MTLVVVPVTQNHVKHFLERRKIVQKTVKIRHKLIVRYKRKITPLFNQEKSVENNFIIIDPNSPIIYKIDSVFKK